VPRRYDTARPLLLQVGSRERPWGEL
jgi:hypothetical protein